MKYKFETKTIGDCCDIIKKSIHPEKGQVYTCFSLPAFDNSNTPEILNGEEIKSSKFVLDENTILFNKLNPKFRRVWNIHSLEKYENTICSTEFLPLKAKANIEQDYLYYYVSSPYFTRLMDGIRTGTSNSQQRIDWKQFLREPINVPSLPIQRKVVSLLRNIDKKIELNNAINNNLLEQALAIYKDWFCDYALSDGILPENWKITTIDAISSLVTRGIAPKYDDSSDQIVLNQKCIRDHTIDISLSRRHLPKKINEKWISKGDLLINSTGTGTLGRVAQVWFEANNMTVDSHVTIVRPKDPILQSYIGFWGLSHESEIEAQHTGSTGQTELPRDRVKAMELPLPDEDTLSKFNELVIPMTSTVISNQEENDRLSQLRDALLPKLMSSELDVSDIDL